MPWPEHQNKLLSALELLYRNDRHLLDTNVNERTLTARLGHYLTGLYPNNDVDCEYNRNGQTSKTLRLLGNRRNYPDIIVHERGTNDHNILVIEAKKAVNNDHDTDHQKLRGFTSPNDDYQYEFGIHLTFGTPTVIDFIVYREEHIDEALTAQNNQAWANGVN